MSPALSTQTLMIDVRELLRAGTGESTELSLVLRPEEIPDADLKEGETQVRLTKLPDEILAQLEGEATLTLVCDRCLEEFELPVSLRASEEFAEHATEDQWPIERDGKIDLTEPIRQLLILEQPTQPLCSPDCPGLCTICGKSLKDNHTHKET